MELRAATLALGMAGILSALSPAMASQPSDKERGPVDIRARRHPAFREGDQTRTSKPDSN